MLFPNAVDNALDIRFSDNSTQGTTIFWESKVSQLKNTFVLTQSRWVFLCVASICCPQQSLFLASEAQWNSPMLRSEKISFWRRKLDSLPYCPGVQTHKGKNRIALPAPGAKYLNSSGNETRCFVVSFTSTDVALSWMEYLAKLCVSST